MVKTNKITVKRLVADNLPAPGYEFIKLASAKNRQGETMLVKWTEEFQHMVNRAFQATAEATGGDILQCCIDCGEEPVITRDGLYDYLETYGGGPGTFGRSGKAAKEGEGGIVFRFVMDHPGSIRDLETTLSQMGVPKSWS